MKLRLRNKRRRHQRERAWSIRHTTRQRAAQDGAIARRRSQTGGGRSSRVSPPSVSAHVAAPSADAPGHNAAPDRNA